MEISSDIRYKFWLRDLLELLILVAIIALILVIYVPRAIWDQEEKDREFSHFKMEDVYNVLDFYKKLTDETTADGYKALNLVNAARDSLTADSTFLGEQIIVLDDNSFKVNMFKNYDVEYDTVFGFLKSKKDTLIDTTLTILSYNNEEESNDTSYIRIGLVKQLKNDTSFVGIIDTIISDHVEIITYYDSYVPDSSIFICPITGEQYKIDISEEGTITVESPIEEYTDRRYLVFYYNTKSHGWIEDGNKSWSRF